MSAEAKSENAISWAANWAIIKACFATAGVGAIGALGGPGVDVPAILGIWAGLLTVLAFDANVPMTKETAVNAITALMSGLAFALVGMKAGVVVFAYSGIGTVPAFIANMGLNATVTYLFGRAAAKALNNPDGFRTAEHFAKSVLRSILSALNLDPVTAGF